VIVEETKKVVKDSDWEVGKTGCVGAKPKHLCYICGNEGFVPVGQGLYRCYREVCVYRDNKGLVNGALKKKICYVCGKFGETHKEIGEYKEIPLFRCNNNMLCQTKLIKGIQMIYADTGVYKYDREAPKDQPPVLLTDKELKELKVQELKEKMTFLEVVVIKI